MRSPDTIGVALTFADGSLGVMHYVTAEYAGDDLRWRRSSTDADILAEIARSSFAQPVALWRRIDLAALPPPSDRLYRNAWVDTGAAIEVDMGKAREIHRNRLRRQRAPIMAELDAAYLQADETANIFEKQRIAGEKQKLRDAPQDPAIDAAKTTAELRAIGLPEVRVA